MKKDNRSRKTNTPSGSRRAGDEPTQSPDTGTCVAAAPPVGVDLAQQENHAVPRWLWLGCILLVIAAALHSADRSIGGGDTWVAMANGRYTSGTWCVDQENRTWQMRILDRFGIHCTQQDYMGAKTRPYDGQSQLGYLIDNYKHKKDQPKDQKTDLPERFGWINQNWLTHYLFFNMREAWGENSIVVYKFLQGILTALLAYWAARKLGAHPVLASGAVAFGMSLSRSFIDLRPNQTTILCAAAMMLVLIYWRSGHKLALFWLVPVMIVWSNVHGGFIYGIMIMMVMVPGHLVQNYLGKGAYFFVLLGFAATLYLLLDGSVALKEDIATLSTRFSGATLEKETAPYHHWCMAGLFAAIVAAGIVVMLFVRYRSVVRAGSFEHVGTGSFYWLLGGAAAVVLIPVVFSPFGMDNLAHPLVIAMGEKGKIWRQVVEWRPIWDKAGFGEAGPYCYFLWLFAIVAVLWWVLLLLRPRDDEPRRRSRRQPQDELPWPKIDLAFIGVIAITLIMSIKSRRFIFLGGVVLAPFVAQMAQDIINMVAVLLARRSELPVRLPRLTRSMAVGLAMLTILAAGAVGTVFGACMWDVYYRPAADGEDLSVFRRMVGIGAQPVEAESFFNLNNVEGIVFNEWVNGGFLTFHQKPQEQTGQALCKVHMDGRSQAAYEVEHFERWNRLKSVIRIRQTREALVELAKLAKELKIRRSDPTFYEKLVNVASSNKKVGQQVARLSRGDPNLQGELQRRTAAQLGREWGLDPRDSDFYPKLVQRSYRRIKDYERVVRCAGGVPMLYDALLVEEGINVVLPSLTKPSGQSSFSLLKRAKSWRLFYVDYKNAIFIRQDGTRNVQLFEDPLANTRYKTETDRQVSQGYALCLSNDKQDWKQGLELLLLAEPVRYVPYVYDAVYSTGLQLGETTRVSRYFERERESVKKELDSGQRFARADNLMRMMAACGRLAEIAKMTGDREKATAYSAEMKPCEQELKEFRDQQRQGGLFW